MSSELHHLAAAYALDALDQDERRSFEQHYPHCDICRADVVSYREVAADLAESEAESPPPELRNRVLDEIGRTPQLEPPLTDDVVALPRRRNGLRMTLAAVAAAVVLLAGFVLLRGDGTGTDRQLVDLLAAPDVGVRPLQGEGSGSVTIMWSTRSRTVAVIGNQLADPGQGMTYALWLLDGTEARPSLLFDPGDDGGVELIGELDGSPTGWGVTIEPAGGSPRPTGEILFAAET